MANPVWYLVIQDVTDDLDLNTALVEGLQKFRLTSEGEGPALAEAAIRWGSYVATHGARRRDGVIYPRSPKLIRALDLDKVFPLADLISPTLPAEFINPGLPSFPVTVDYDSAISELLERLRIANTSGIDFDAELERVRTGERPVHIYLFRPADRVMGGEVVRRLDERGLRAADLWETLSFIEQAPRAMIESKFVTAYDRRWRNAERLHVVPYMEPPPNGVICRGGDLSPWDLIHTFPAVRKE